MSSRSCLVLAFILVGAAACQTVLPASSTPTVEPTPTPEATPEATAVSEPAPNWKQLEVKDVQLGIQIPRGWEVQETNDGILIAEHFGTMQSGALGQGMQIYLFVHALDGYRLPNSSEANVAWAVLEQIIKKRDVIGDAKVSDPTGFQWDGHDAAYYLLNDNNESLSVLVAVAISNPERLVVCNFSSPARQGAEIRTMLPDVLSTLTINGLALDIAALHNLPDPLVFPAVDPTITP